MSITSYPKTTFRYFAFKAKQEVKFKNIDNKNFNLDLLLEFTIDNMCNTRMAVNASILTNSIGTISACHGVYIYRLLKYVAQVSLLKQNTAQFLK